MKAATWLLLKSMLADALEHRSSRRLSFIKRACRGRPALYEEARSLLAEAQDDDFLESPYESDPIDDDASAARWLGHRVGSLRIHRLLGRGGMGHVFLGVADGSAAERAAIKIPSSIGCPSAAAEALGHEHDVLSRLDHPLIVRSFGPAAVGGLPCLVMEYVDGVPIDSYCSQRSLGVAGRVALVMRACAALAHAHSRGVVHADVKPAHILVTPSGEPRLVDFGISRRLDAQAPAVPCGPGADGAIYAAFTPESASPEQLRNQPVSPVSDVYAVGVVLYRLLTGRLPHEQQGPITTWQRLRAVCNDDPLPPSQLVRSGKHGSIPGLPNAPELARQLEGKLDLVIGRALARDPQFRYASVEPLAQDLSAALLELGTDPAPCLSSIRTSALVRPRHAASV